jgi:hypothetical protein
LNLGGDFLASGASIDARTCDTTAAAFSLTSKSSAMPMLGGVVWICFMGWSRMVGFYAPERKILRKMSCSQFFEHFLVYR